eukprot:SAG11_NODE_510_length_8851_cov_25.360718_7_plen_118_part_00
MKEFAEATAMELAARQQHAAHVDKISQRHTNFLEESTQQSHECSDKLKSKLKDLPACLGSLKEELAKPDSYVLELRVACLSLQRWMGSREERLKKQRDHRRKELAALKLDPCSRSTV